VAGHEKGMIMAKRKPVGVQVVESLRALKECLQSGDRLEDRFPVRRYLVGLKPRRFTAKDVKATRHRLGMSQAVFADVLAVSVKTVQAWEQRGVQSPMACRLLQTIEPWWRNMQSSTADRRVG
jgi:DNA-binding transcriptional regulator YiaG